MENSKHGNRSLMNLKLIRICISNGFNWYQKKDTKNKTNNQNLPYLNHHLIKSNKIHSVEKLSVKELYLISLQHETATTTSQRYFESMFWNWTFQCTHIYTLPCITTIDSKLQYFPYKILHNNLCLNQKHFKFHKHFTLLIL